MVQLLLGRQARCPEFRCFVATAVGGSFVRKEISRAASAVLLSLVIVALTSSAVLAYLYKAPVAITENASTSYTMLPILWDQNNAWLANNGFMDSTANDTRVQTLGGLNKPWMVADNKTLTAIPVPADSQTNLYFVTGESEASAMDIIVGYGGYITVSDNATLEIGDNFTIEQSGYVDTSSGSDKNLVYKSGALRTYISAASNIRSAILDWASTFPTVVTDNSSSVTVADTSHTVGLPDGIVSGDLLLVYFNSDEDKTITFPGG